jgi:Pyridoxamine 5'-phosphate oxidase
MTSFPESRRDLLEAQFASLATLGGDGIPRVTEVWFLLDEGELRLSLNTSRLKTRNLLRGPQWSLCCSTFRPKSVSRRVARRWDSHVTVTVTCELVTCVSERGDTGPL